MGEKKIIRILHYKFPTTWSKKIKEISFLSEKAKLYFLGKYLIKTKFNIYVEKNKKSYV